MSDAVTVRDRATGKRLTSIRSDAGYSVAFSPGADHLLAFSVEAMVCLLDRDRDARRRIPGVAGRDAHRRDDRLAAAFLEAAGPRFDGR